MKNTDEYSALRAILRPHRAIEVNNGDDAAVFGVQPAGSRVVMSTDTIVDTVHFDSAYFTPRQVGIKALESSASDIVAMAARPTHAVVALSLPDAYTLDDLKALYDGLYASGDRLGTAIIGGDISRTPGPLTLTVTVVGSLPASHEPRLRSGARPGDRVYVSGPLGGSHAGLRSFQSKLTGRRLVEKYHTEPACRIDLVDDLQRFASALIDISDGLASESWHIARASRVRVILAKESIPVLDCAREVATDLGEDPIDYALHGGEDYELLFTCGGAEVPRGAIEVGEILEGEGVFLKSGGNVAPLARGGFDHFSPAGPRGQSATAAKNSSMARGGAA